MIRILIADKLSPSTIDKLNEITEFEIIEKANLTPGKLATEIKNVEAVVVSGKTRLTATILKGAGNLKIIVLDSNRRDNVDTAMARRKNIEIREIQQLSTSRSSTPAAKKQGREGVDVIAILKDFFNV